MCRTRGTLLESESAADHATPDSRPGAGGAQGATKEGTRPLARAGPSEKAPPVPMPAQGPRMTGRASGPKFIMLPTGRGLCGPVAHCRAQPGASSPAGATFNGVHVGDRRRVPAREVLVERSRRREHASTGSLLGPSHMACGLFGNQLQMRPGCAPQSTCTEERTDEHYWTPSGPASSRTALRSRPVEAKLFLKDDKAAELHEAILLIQW
jgi:hypothetical protein